MAVPRHGRLRVGAWPRHRYPGRLADWLTSPGSATTLDPMTTALRRLALTVALLGFAAQASSAGLGCDQMRPTTPVSGAHHHHGGDAPSDQGSGPGTPHAPSCVCPAACHAPMATGPQATVLGVPVVAFEPPILAPSVLLPLLAARPHFLPLANAPPIVA